MRNKPTNIHSLKLYHKDVYLPDEVLNQIEKCRHFLTWSRHASKARFDDRYGTVPQLGSVALNRVEFIEVQTNHDKVCKFVVRVPLDERDIVMVLMPTHPYELLVKTVWFNKKDDTHNTLDRSKYYPMQPAKGR